MTVQRLSKLADWRLKDESQDLRGRPLYDREGKRLGTIEDMLVDTDDKLVHWVVLEDGKRVNTEAITIEEDGVYLDDGSHTRSAPPPA